MKRKKKEEEETEERDVEIPLLQRSLNISTMHTSIEISSQDKKDTLKDMKKIAEEILDKYKV